LAVRVGSSALKHARPMERRRSTGVAPGTPAAWASARGQAQSRWLGRLGQRAHPVRDLMLGKASDTKAAGAITDGSEELWLSDRPAVTPPWTILSICGPMPVSSRPRWP